MFSILNEIKDNSRKQTTGVAFASIGLAASVYVLVAITGYLSFGDKVTGNIISMCKSKMTPTPRKPLLANTIPHRQRIHRLNHRPRRHRRPSHVLLPAPNPPLPRLNRQHSKMASLPRPHQPTPGLRPPPPKRSPRTHVRPQVRNHLHNPHCRHLRHSNDRHLPRTSTSIRRLHRLDVY